MPIHLKLFCYYIVRTKEAWALGAMWLRRWPKKEIVVDWFDVVVMVGH